MRGPLSIKEIALQLHISYATAKRHTINIYAKLGVNQRWNAVARAEELNILPHADQFLNNQAHKGWRNYARHPLWAFKLIIYYRSTP